MPSPGVPLGFGRCLSLGLRRGGRISRHRRTDHQIVDDDRRPVTRILARRQILGGEDEIAARRAEDDGGRAKQLLRSESVV